MVLPKCFMFQESVRWLTCWENLFFALDWPASSGTGLYDMPVEITCIALISALKGNTLYL